MKIQYCSDLHLEFPLNRDFLKKHPLVSSAEVLVLAGDIVPFALMDKHQDFFSSVSDHFKSTYWLPGNHEYYRFDLAEKCGMIHEKIRDNVLLVNNTSIAIKEVRLIFSTLWSKISPGHAWQIERSMNDFHVIRYEGNRLSSDQYNRLHEESLAFIQQALIESKEEKIAVFTHHAPTFLHYPEQYKGDILNEAFAVELFDLIETSEIDCWVYGHHHSNTPSFKIGKTSMLTNQLGYVQMGEHFGFETDKVISGF